MKFFLDTASLKDISWAAQAGLIDGITTNPSLLSKQAGDLDPKDVLKEICSLVEGPVSAEVVAVDVGGMVKEGKELAKIADNIVVKVPMIEPGMVAVRPRIIFDNYQIATEILAASIRHPRHVVEAAMIGADVVTLPPDVLKKLLLHPLTDRGLEQFLADWRKLAARAKASV